MKSCSVDPRVGFLVENSGLSGAFAKRICKDLELEYDLDTETVKLGSAAIRSFKRVCMTSISSEPVESTCDSFGPFATVMTLFDRPGVGNKSVATIARREKCIHCRIDVLKFKAYFEASQLVLAATPYDVGLDDLRERFTQYFKASLFFLFREIEDQFSRDTEVRSYYDIEVPCDRDEVFLYLNFSSVVALREFNRVINRIEEDVSDRLLLIHFDEAQYLHGALDDEAATRAWGSDAVEAHQLLFSAFCDALASVSSGHKVMWAMTGTAEIFPFKTKYMSDHVEHVALSPFLRDITAAQALDVLKHYFTLDMSNDEMSTLVELCARFQGDPYPLGIFLATMTTLEPPLHNVQDLIEKWSIGERSVITRLKCELKPALEQHKINSRIITLLYVASLRCPWRYRVGSPLSVRCSALFKYGLLEMKGCFSSRDPGGSVEHMEYYIKPISYYVGLVCSEYVTVDGGQRVDMQSVNWLGLLIGTEISMSSESPLWGYLHERIQLGSPLNILSSDWYKTQDLAFLSTTSYEHGNIPADTILVSTEENPTCCSEVEVHFACGVDDKHINLVRLGAVADFTTGVGRLLLDVTRRRFQVFYNSNSAYGLWGEGLNWKLRRQRNHKLRTARSWDRISSRDVKSMFQDARDVARAQLCEQEISFLFPVKELLCCEPTGTESLIATLMRAQTLRNPSTYAAGDEVFCSRLRGQLVLPPTLLKDCFNDSVCRSGLCSDSKLSLTVRLCVLKLTGLSFIDRPACMRHLAAYGFSESDTIHLDSSIRELLTPKAILPSYKVWHLLERFGEYGTSTAEVSILARYLRDWERVRCIDVQKASLDALLSSGMAIGTALSCLGYISVAHRRRLLFQSF